MKDGEDSSLPPEQLKTPAKDPTPKTKKSAPPKEKSSAKEKSVSSRKADGAAKKVNPEPKEPTSQLAPESLRRSNRDRTGKRKLSAIWRESYIDRVEAKVAKNKANATANGSVDGPADEGVVDTGNATSVDQHTNTSSIQKNDEADNEPTPARPAKRARYAAPVLSNYSLRKTRARSNRNATESSKKVDDNKATQKTQYNEIKVVTKKSTSKTGKRLGLTDTTKATLGEDEDV
ncbi:hypothetical protein M501DRAFT_1013383 [Patellaria atrata CBS 101060]|uniref:Uncharacterized protein n=1 Tax=Patellaria atrata CBS 101060 TaxID=1346257 RepID=A0A9P4SGQ8_9PEZI|nr:hypothetical protein M501DRAFT_1013383 [Patellaria atrata CBS 101060]